MRLTLFLADPDAATILPSAHRLYGWSALQTRHLLDPYAQADPKLETSLAFTRVTARAVREELLKNDELSPLTPCRQTVGEILNRLGYRLRPVMKTVPEKRFQKRTTCLPTCLACHAGSRQFPQIRYKARRAIRHSPHLILC